MTFRRAEAAGQGRKPADARQRPTAPRVAAFWFEFVWQTLGSRRISRLVRARLDSRNPPDVTGADQLPSRAVFVVAANHFRYGPALDTIAALLHAAGTSRPDLADRWLLVAGRTAPERARLPARLIRRGLRLVYYRWRKNVLHIPLRNERPLPSGLREWRRRAAAQPSLVFPEGKARREFGAPRAGSGRWLASLSVATVPAAVWWDGHHWQVRFGAPIPWTHRPELRDHQLGLAIAALLPPEFAPEWQEPLTRWRAAHTAAVTTA